MAYHADTHHVSPTSLPAICRVDSDRPWLWLAAGWDDFTRTAGVSMIYGFVVSAIMVLAFALLQSINSYHLALALMAGFVFLGPVLAVGLYELSRRIEHRKIASLPDTWRGWGRNSGAVLTVGVVLMLLMLAWLMLSMQLAAVLYGVSGELGQVFGTAETWQSFAFSIQWPLLAAFALVGAVAVVVAFLLTVVAVPMLTDKEDMDAITAMVCSVRAVRRNPGTMALWAGLIALFSAVAVAPLFLGLIVVFPLLAYASWHAYQDLIEH
ncbi:MAG: DUF2189 domain-containing protein [Gammaproteobacteria bacterium]|nr:DUF2189 domain-containing protein [Gammaproteobacteria bacterium]MCW8972394.1 DUF2189 domain-containing protein [Gammaproteobacteria bacterium]MCW8992644.1 DUF2189 domain-containing protein [Gammaproteobacteria bacterium]